MTQMEKNRMLWNSILVIGMVVLPLFFLSTSRTFTANRVFHIGALAMGCIIPIMALRPWRLRVVSFDKPLATCIVVGAVIGYFLPLATVTVTSELSVPQPLPKSGDATRSVTSTYKVFGLAIAEYTSPTGADRFIQFVSLVSLVFVTVGMVAGWLIHRSLFWQHRGASRELPAAE